MEGAQVSASGVEERRAPVLVVERMKVAPPTCEARATLDVAKKILLERGADELLITGEEGELLGCLTDRDISMIPHTLSKPLQEIAVSTVMETRVVACQPDDTLATAKRLMRKHPTLRIVVVDTKNRPVGVLLHEDVSSSVAPPPSIEPPSSREIEGARVVELAMVLGGERPTLPSAPTARRGPPSTRPKRTKSRPFVPVVSLRRVLSPRER